MAKKQTRRSLSLNRLVYLEVMRVAHEAGVSAAEWLTELIRERIPGLPKSLHFDPVKREYRSRRLIVHAIAPTPDISAATAMNEAIRGTVRKPPAIVLSTEDVERRQHEHEQQALANPCRRDYCRIMGLHAADVPRHSKKIAARGVVSP